MQNVNAHVVASHILFEWKQILNKCDNYVSMKMLFFFLFGKSYLMYRNIPDFHIYLVGNEKMRFNAVYRYLNVIKQLIFKLKLLFNTFSSS